MNYSSANFHSKHTPILKEINEAAYEIINDRPEGIIPTTGGRFTIVRHDLTVDDELICEYRVYSYRTLVAFVTFHPYSVRIPTIRVCKDAFDHSRTTSKHEIELLLSQCRATLDRIQQGHGGRLHKDWRFTLTDDTKEQEICYTIRELERVLKEWGPSDAKPLHFYSRQTRRFQAYEL